VTDDAVLGRLAGLAEVQEPATPTSPGALFLMAVVATFGRYKDVLRAQDLQLVAARSLPGEPQQVLAVADDLHLLTKRGDDARPEITLRATEALHQVALRLATALLAERRWQSVLGSAGPPAIDNEHRPLSRDEDARLRTLSAMRVFGTLAPEAEALRASLRKRDLRTEVREPDPVVVLRP
jgi:hypothetical protein